MKYRSTNNWSDTTKLKELLFAAQRLDELTFEYTLDSYRAPTTNVPFILKECLFSIELHKEKGLPINSVQKILEETESKLKNNIIVKSVLDINLDNYLSYNADDINDIEKHIRILSHELSVNTYIDKCIEMIKHSIEQSERKELDFLLGEFVTSLQNILIDGKFINETVVDFFFSRKKIKDNSQFDEFIKIIIGHIHEYDIIIKIKSPINVLSKEIIDLFNCKIIKSLPSNYNINQDNYVYFKLQTGECLLQFTKVKSHDRYTAIKLVKSNIARMHDLYGIYHHKGTYSYSHKAIVKMACCSEKTKLTNVNNNKMHYVSDNKPEQAALKLGTMVKYLRLPSGPDRETFFRIIDFHGMSLQSGVIENQLLNIWTAMETIVPNKGETKIITGVIKGSLPLIGLQYFRRLFEQLSYDLTRWNKSKLNECLEVSVSPDGSDFIEQIFCLVATQENEAAASLLLSKLNDFELMKFRISQIHYMFKSKKRINKKLKEHMQRVEWQLHRIYRTRNSIVHSAQSLDQTDMLVLNAHDYFDQIFLLTSELCSYKTGFNNYTDCFNYSYFAYNQYEKLLQSLPDETLTSDVKKILWSPSRK
ncbi:hypothetical protein [Ochrobactrum sp. S1502_03]|uniref:hypothetical protein n=1 Tax=Ochrobactrum sp. S1502_03 TaxID=3108451 RepID=UPI0037C86F17